MNAWKYVAMLIMCLIVGFALLIIAMEDAKPLEPNQVRLCNEWSVPPRCFVVTVTPSPLSTD